jgi:hypothetical protein
MQKITKITKQEAKITAKLYISSLFDFYDAFETGTADSTNESLATDEVNMKIQNEIDLIVSKLKKGLENSCPQTSYECILEAKKMVREIKS